MAIENVGLGKLPNVYFENNSKIMTKSRFELFLI